jgi:hypothetical protein
VEHDSGLPTMVVEAGGALEAAGEAPAGISGPRHCASPEHEGREVSFTAHHDLNEGGWHAEAGVGERVAAWPTKCSSLRARSSRAIRSSVRAS